MNEIDQGRCQLLIIGRRVATARAARSTGAARTSGTTVRPTRAATGTTGTAARPARPATGTTRAAATARATHAHGRAEQIFRRQTGRAGFEERFQGGGSIGDFVGVNHPVVVGVQGEEDRRQRAAALRPALAARRRPAIAPLRPGTRSVVLLGDNHPR